MFLKYVINIWEKVEDVFKVCTCTFGPIVSKFGIYYSTI